MKKICIISGNIYKFGGEQATNVMLANMLAGIPGYEVTFVSIFKTGDTPCYDFDSRIIQKNVFGTQFAFKKHLARTFIGMRRFFKSSSPYDLVITWTNYSIYLSFILPKKTKTIYWDHLGFSVGKPFGLTWLGRRFAARFGDAVVAITKKNKDGYIEHVRKINRLEMIYHGTKCRVRENVYNSSSKKIISCGRLNYQKGFDILVEVADLVFKRHPDWQWHIYGEGEDRKALEKKIAEYGIGRNLVLKGYCSDLESVYKDYSFYVMTSRFEGLPVALVEATAKSLPIVSFNCPTGPDEIVDDSKTGFIVDCFDKEKMAEKICELIENQQLREEFSEAAAKRFSMFSYESFARNWSELIASVLETPSK
jgi:glycosyltransferase involved in cell wall biosynthesis